MEFHCYKTSAAVMIAAVVSSMMTVVTSTLLNGPDPMTAVEPVGAIVTFTCVVNTTERPAGTTLFGIGGDELVGWIVNGTILEGNRSVTENGALQIGTFRIMLLPEHITISGIPVQCEVIIRESSTMFTPFRSNVANLTAYGPPEAPSNLISTQPSDNAVILSWSAPSSPVQLHYTVTVWANTSTITMFNTSSTTITISRDNITGNSSNCDIYTFTVIAINPAGSSIPADHTSTFILESAPNSVQSDFCVSNGTGCATVNYTAYSCTNTADTAFTIVVRDICNDTKVTIASSMRSYNIPYTMNCSNITIIAENELGILKHSVNTTGPEECMNPIQTCSSAAASHFPLTSSLVLTNSPAASIILSSNGYPVSTVIGLSLGVVIAYFLGLGTASAIAVTLWLCIRKRSDKARSNKNTDDLLTTTNDAYGIHVTKPSVAPVYESVDTK